VRVPKAVTVLAGSVFKINTNKGQDQHKVGRSGSMPVRLGMIACYV
jgi:hypothetical protein